MYLLFFALIKAPLTAMTSISPITPMTAAGMATVADTIPKAKSIPGIATTANPAATVAADFLKLR